MEWADLNATVKSAGQFSRQILGRKNLHLETDLDLEMPLVLHDPQLVREVIVNLLLNSVQATDPGGWIQFQTRFDPKNGAAEIVVRDNGRGISPELLPRIFQPFFTTRGSEGTGLGLSLCKRIIEQHGGNIGVFSIPGEGTEFTIRRPMQVPEPATKS